MTLNCAECGAVLPENTTCQSIFETFLSLEFTDPAFGAVHFLTVSCFMIQHGRYSDKALSWIQPVVRGHLENKLTPAQLRQLARKGTSSDTRTCKIKRSTNEPPVPKIIWSMTIADVAKDFKDAQSYCDLVKLWSHLTLQELAYTLNH